jgi:hypothetical protein
MYKENFPERPKFLNSDFRSIQIKIWYSWARIIKPLKEARNRFPAWQAGTTTYLTYLPARLCRLAELIPRNRFLGFLKGLQIQARCQTKDGLGWEDAVILPECLTVEPHPPLPLHLLHVQTGGWKRITRNKNWVWDKDRTTNGRGEGVER